MRIVALQKYVGKQSHLTLRIYSRAASNDWGGGSGVALKKELKRRFETLVNTYYSTWRNIPKDSHPQQQKGCDNPKSRTRLAV
jgi:hypothetical protein